LFFRFHKLDLFNGYFSIEDGIFSIRIKPNPNFGWRSKFKANIIKKHASTFLATSIDKKVPNLNFNCM